MAMIADKIAQVRARIARACAGARRDVQTVTLLCVGKTVAPAALREAFEAGERSFAENYVQEGVDKIVALAGWRQAIEWHLIGPLQSNKTRVVAEHFDWVHSIDRLKTAQRLNDQRPAHLAPLQVCLQVKLSAQASKSGIAPGELAGLAHAVAGLPRLRLRGLMAIPEPGADSEQRRAPYRALCGLRDALGASGLALDTLSMGMSDDLEDAITEGATLVRVGSAIFGARG